MTNSIFMTPPHTQVYVPSTDSVMTVTDRIMTQYGYHEEDHEASGALLHEQDGPFHGGYDDHSQGATPMETPSSYTLHETYQTPGQNAPPPFAGALQDPSAAFGVPGRAPSPYERSETSSTEAWRQRQQQAMGPSGGLKRYATRKVKLVQGQVLSVDYPVPSAIQNAIQTKYRNDLEGGSEEFTHLRCTLIAYIVSSTLLTLY